LLEQEFHLTTYTTSGLSPPFCPTQPYHDVALAIRLNNKPAED